MKPTFNCKMIFLNVLQCQEQEVQNKTIKEEDRNKY